MRVGKLKEPGRGESVGFNLLVFIASSALAYTSGVIAHRCHRRMGVTQYNKQLLMRYGIAHP